MATAEKQTLTNAAAIGDERRHWGRAALWLMFLGPFFFISYGFANWYASQQSGLPHIVFDWEKSIPFIAWTIIPYWSIDFFYAISPFICRSRHELDAHGKRLFVAQIIAVSCFILFPLEFSFARPQTSGISGDLFIALSSFDQPFNQAPSLHIALLVILWALYRRHLPLKLLWPFHVLCAFIAISVLTTYQHHFIDIPTGALLGSLCVWLWPLHDKPIYDSAKLNRHARAWRIALYYSAGALLLSLLALFLGGVWLWLFWPVISLLLVAVNYLYLGSRGFQKDSMGQIGTVARWLYWPYLVAAKINSRLWTRAQQKYSLICDRVYLGRMPSAADIRRDDFYAVIDMSAEMSKPDAPILWRSRPCLDLMLPSKEDLLTAATWIDQFRESGKVLVVCALGYSRSALAVATWLLLSKQVATVEEAIHLIRQQRPNIVIDDQARRLLSTITP